MLANITWVGMSMTKIQQEVWSRCKCPHVFGSNSLLAQILWHSTDNPHHYEQSWTSYCAATVCVSTSNLAICILTWPKRSHLMIAVEFNFVTKRLHSTIILFTKSSLKTDCHYLWWRDVTCNQCAVIVRHHHASYVFLDVFCTTIFDSYAYCKLSIIFHHRSLHLELLKKKRQHCSTGNTVSITHNERCPWHLYLNVNKVSFC